MEVLVAGQIFCRINWSSIWQFLSDFVILMWKFSLGPLWLYTYIFHGDGVVHGWGMHLDQMISS